MSRLSHNMPVCSRMVSALFNCPSMFSIVPSHCFSGPVRGSSIELNSFIYLIVFGDAIVFMILFLLEIEKKKKEILLCSFIICI